MFCGSPRPGGKGFCKTLSSRLDPPPRNSPGSFQYLRRLGNPAAVPPLLQAIIPGVKTPTKSKVPSRFGRSLCRLVNIRLSCAAPPVLLFRRFCRCRRLQFRRLFLPISRVLLFHFVRVRLLPLSEIRAPGLFCLFSHCNSLPFRTYCASSCCYRLSAHIIAQIRKKGKGIGIGMPRNSNKFERPRGGCFGSSAGAVASAVCFFTPHDPLPPGGQFSGTGGRLCRMDRPKL